MYTRNTVLLIKHTIAIPEFMFLMSWVLSIHLCLKPDIIIAQCLFVSQFRHSLLNNLFKTYFLDQNIKRIGNKLVYQLNYCPGTWACQFLKLISFVTEYFEDVIYHLLWGFRTCHLEVMLYLKLYIVLISVWDLYRVLKKILKVIEDR